jgi:hypothetical protein
MYTEAARKQRNRDAQAAFRERRIEYIKELEERVKAYSTRLRAMEAARTNSADECLMLRYKNSLLERILLHKGSLSGNSSDGIVADDNTVGIDVNAELNIKLWRPVGVPMQSYLTRDPALSLKRKANNYHTPRASEITSPISTASESTIPTPPGPILPRPHKRSKTHNANSTTQIPIPPGKYPFLIFIFKRTMVLD